MAVYSEDTNNSPFLFKTEASGGYLWSSSEGSIPWCSAQCTEHVQLKNGTIAFNAAAIATKSTLSQCNGNLEGGMFSLSFEHKNIRFTSGVSGFSAPNDMHILEGKPRFVLNNGNGECVFGEIDLRIPSIDSSFTIGSVYGHAEWDDGDLYYFYGKPSLPHFWGVYTDFSFPFELDANASFFSSDPEIVTNEDSNLGSGTLKAAAGRLLKKFPVTHNQSISLGFDYLFLDFDFAFSITNKTQTYMFFPYIYLYANANAQYHAGGFDIQYAFSSNHFSFIMLLSYFYCFCAQGTADWNYKYKKNIIYDGSSDSGSKEFPDPANSSLLVGKIEGAYSFRHCSFKMTKLIAIPFLTDSFSSGSNSSSSGSSSTDWSVDLPDVLRKYALSGLSFSLAVSL